MIAWSGIRARRLASDGSALGDPFLVTTYATGDDHRTAIATDADGDFVVVWDSFGSSGSDPDYSIQARVFSAPEPSSGLLLVAAIGAAATLARIRSGDQIPNRST